MKTFLEMMETYSGPWFPLMREGGVGNIGECTQDSNCTYNLSLKLSGGFMGILYFISVLCIFEIPLFFP